MDCGSDTQVFCITLVLLCYRFYSNCGLSVNCVGNIFFCSRMFRGIKGHHRVQISPANSHEGPSGIVTHIWQNDLSAKLCY